MLLNKLSAAYLFWVPSLGLTREWTMNRLYITFLTPLTLNPKVVIFVLQLNLRK